MIRASLSKPAGCLRLPAIATLLVLFGASALCAALAGCGPADTLTSAATTAKAEADAAKQAKEQKEQIESQIRTMQQTEQKRVDSVSEQADRASQ